MFSGALIGFLAAVSSATWVYTKVLRRTGGNNKSSLTTAAIAGVFVFVITVTIVATIDSMVGN